MILDQDLLTMPAEKTMLSALSAGVRFFQYRSKNSSRRHIYDVSLRLSRIARDHQALFVVNDHADIAVAADADGVHLGQDDLPLQDARKITGSGMVIGISTHNKEQAAAAQKEGADYIGFGPVFHTSTKDAGVIQGLDALAGIKALVSIPVIAIGGIKHGNVREVKKTGADGMAVISAILTAADPELAAADMLVVINDKN